ncbi:VWA domain-containing protein [Candidatus Micrarchaeota archaeon]|nr:VWA domain-containing protein [Candidatus Micrarchaeota archaeon]
MRYKKAQISGLDLILAIMLFSTAIILFSILWEVVQYNVKTSTDANVIAIQVANRLLDSPGYPLNWNATNVQLIGLSSDRGVMDQEKLQNLINLLNNPATYDQARTLLGLGPYQICVNMTYPDGTPVIINNQTNQTAVGGNCNISATSSSSITRTALYGEVVVHNNSITFILDSSGSMNWYSTSLGYTPGGNLTSSWVNTFNVTFNSTSSNFDFVMETNDSGSSNSRINVTSPSGIKYGCRDGNPGCTNCGTGCTATHYSGADYLNFTSSRWENGTWRVYVKKYNHPGTLSYDAMAQTPPVRIDAAKNATKNFINLIHGTSSSKDEIALYRFNPVGGGCNSLRLSNFTQDNNTLIGNVSTITANGATPIAQTLKDAADNSLKWATKKHTMMILVSDGSETCNMSTTAVSDAALYAINYVEKICTVGFAQGTAGEDQLRTVARIGKCQYYSARNQAQLAQALTQIYFGNLEKQNVWLTIVVWK